MKADRKTANLMKGALTELALKRASSIVRMVRVSAATVGRFCRSLGPETDKHLDRIIEPYGKFTGHVGDPLTRVETG